MIDTIECTEEKIVIKFQKESNIIKYILSFIYFFFLNIKNKEKILNNILESDSIKEKEREEKTKAKSFVQEPTAATKKAPARPKEKYPAEIDEVLAYLNTTTGRTFNIKAAGNRKLCSARLNEGYDKEELKRAIDNCARRWKDDPDMSQYLRPLTIFRASKVDGYINDIVPRLKPVRRRDRGWN